MFLRCYLAQVLSALLACFIDRGVHDHRVLLKVLDSLSSVQILKETITQKKKTTCEMIMEEEQTERK